MSVIFLVVNTIALFNFTLCPSLWILAGISTWFTTQVTCNCVEQAAYLCNKAATPEFNDTIILSLSATECPFAWGYCLDSTSNQFADGDDHAVFTFPPDWGACYIGMANVYNGTIIEGWTFQQFQWIFSFQIPKQMLGCIKSIQSKGGTKKDRKIILILSAH